MRYRLAGGIIEAPTLPAYARLLLTAGLALPLTIAGRWLGRRGRRGTLHSVTRLAGRTLLRGLGVRLTIAGLEHIDRTEQYVVVPLHEGFADVPALSQLPLPLRFVARDELFGWRFLGPLLRDTGQVLIYPERGALSFRPLLRAAREVFAAGESLAIFPQGTILGIETDYHLGAFVLAQRLGRPLLPVALTGAHRVWEHPYTPRVRLGEQMGLRVLPPIPAAEVRAAEPEELRIELRRRTKAAALDGTLPPPRRFVPERDGFWDGFAYSIDPDFPALAAQIAAHRAAVASPLQAEPAVEIV